MRNFYHFYKDMYFWESVELHHYIANARRSCHYHELELIQESTPLTITIVEVNVPASETLSKVIMQWASCVFFPGHSAVYESTAWQIMDEMKDWLEFNENVLMLF